MQTEWTEWENNFDNEEFYPWQWLHPNWFWDFNFAQTLDSIPIELGLSSFVLQGSLIDNTTSTVPSGNL